MENRISEELVRAALSNEIIGKAHEMLEDTFSYNGFSDRMSVEMFGIDFRLFKTAAGNINLEFLVQHQTGLYFKPICIYYKNRTVLLNEYFITYEKLQNEGHELGYPDSFTKPADALIAAFSKNAAFIAYNALQEVQTQGFDDIIQAGIMIPATVRFDKSFFENGFKCELLFSFEGYPQFYLNDDHNFPDMIAAYQMSNHGMSISPALKYKNLFDELNSMSLLTAYASI
ncbi:MAG: hypothetical protein ACTIKA_10200 [Psychroflexus halocasei]